MSKNITVNGTTYDASYVSAPLADGSGNAKFRESSELSLQSKSVTPTESQQTVTPASDYFALDKVTVGAIPSEYVKPTVTNPGGELTAGSTIAAGTYFSGAATVPSGGNNPIVSLNTEAGTVDEAVWKIIAKGEIIGQDSGGNNVTAGYDGFLFYPSKGTDHVYTFYGTEHTGPFNGEWIKIVISQFNSSKATGSFVKDNSGGLVANLGMDVITAGGKTCYYVSNSLSIPAASYVGYAIPYSAIGWV